MIAALLVAAAVTTGSILGLVAWRRSLQRRVARTLRIDGRAAIVEERFVSLGGIDQWILIRGADRANPVLLIVHGGPGWPNSVFTPLLLGWERHFTVVQWDQRGAGKTLGRNGKAGSEPVTFEQRASDGIELVEHLRRHLGHERVILLAESMGTLVGAPMVHRRPDLFAAYVATDLYVSMARNEALKRELTIGRLTAAGNRKAVAALERIGADPARWTLRDWSVVMRWTFRTNLPSPGLERTLLLPRLIASPLHRLRDLWHLVAGFQFCAGRMFAEMMAFDLRRLGPGFQVPYFVIQGACDVVTLTPLAREHFDEVEAPVKGFAEVEDAGHFAAFTHPARFLEALLRLLGPALDQQAGPGRRQMAGGTAARSPRPTG